MRKTFLVLCIVALALLGLNMLPERTATADSDFAIGNLSTIAEKLGVEPDEAGKYNLASILEAFYDDHRYTRSVFSQGILSIESRVGQLENEVPSGSGSLDQLNDLGDWTERELNKLWGNLNQLSKEIQPGSGSYLESRLQQLEQHMRWVERELNDLWNQINNCCR